MSSKFTSVKTITRSAALVLLTCGFFQLSVGAQSSGQSSEDIIVVETALVGLARGDRLRVTVGHSNKPCGARCANNLKQIGLALHAYDGDVIVQSNEIAIEPDQFHSFDLDRDDLPLAGEPGTGRLQVLVEIRSRFFSIVDRTHMTLDAIPASLEIIDKSNGKTLLLVPSVQKVRASAVHLN